MDNLFKNVQVERGMFMGVVWFTKGEHLERFMDTDLQVQLEHDVIYRPIPSRNGLMELKRMHDGNYRLYDLENGERRELCRDEMRSAFRKHPLKIGQRITFYLREV